MIPVKNRISNRAGGPAGESKGESHVPVAPAIFIQSRGHPGASRWPSRGSASFAETKVVAGAVTDVPLQAPESPWSTIAVGMCALFDWRMCKCDLDRLVILPELPPLL